MMDSKPIYQDQHPFAPLIELSKDDSTTGAMVLRDVQSVQYNESMDGLDSFEFVLNDWDPLTNTVKYSSPYDSAGKLRMVNGETVVNFEPGSAMVLKMGYNGTKDHPITMMRGRISAISPTFPASGLPTVTYTAVSELRQFVNQQEVVAFEGKKPSEICAEVVALVPGMSGLKVETPNKDNEEIIEYKVMANVNAIEFLWALARQIDYEVRLSTDEKGDELFYFGPRPENDTLLELKWGQSLISFSPQIKIRGLVNKVVVKGWNPKAKGDDRTITGEATLADLNTNMPDSNLLDEIGSAVEESIESVVDEAFESEAEANQRAKDILSKMMRDVITGSGSCIGDPRVRAGSTLLLVGMGGRYDGEYLVKSTTHTIDGSGYMTSFNVELKGVVA